MTIQTCGNCRWRRRRVCLLRSSPRSGVHEVSSKGGRLCALWDPMESRHCDGMNTPPELPRSCGALARAMVECEDYEGIGGITVQARAGMRRNNVPTGDRGDKGERWHES